MTDLYDADEILWWVHDLTENLLTKIRMGVYDPGRHGTLEEILEEIRRALNDRDI